MSASVSSWITRWNRSGVVAVLLSLALARAAVVTTPSAILRSGISISFLPTVAGKKCFIPFLLGQNDSISDSVGSDSEGEEFAAAIMSSAKCRILLSKNLIPEIETAYFEGKGGQNFSIPVFDYGEANCLEIPFIILTQEGMYRTDRVVIIKK